MSGDLTVADFKRAFLWRIGEDGWDRPAGLDVTGMTPGSLTAADVNDIAQFARGLMRTWSPRGRLAILVATPLQRTLACAFRTGLGAAEESRIAVVDTRDDAERWLDGEPVSEAHA
ncbi:MAG: hypothetical protein QM736_20850 [Vicinamibacterales bacterium]